MMLIPVLMPLAEAGEHAHHMPATNSLMLATLAVLVHSLAMLVTTGVVALIVYEWVGLDFLRRGWINLDLDLDRGADRHGFVAIAGLSSSEPQSLSAFEADRAILDRNRYGAQVHPIGYRLHVEREAIFTGSGQQDDRFTQADGCCFKEFGACHEHPLRLTAVSSLTRGGGNRPRWYSFCATLEAAVTDFRACTASQCEP